MKTAALYFGLIFLSANVCVGTASADGPSPLDLPNFAQVNANLYRGGHPTATGMNDLSQMGVRTLINLEGGDMRSILSPFVFLLERGERASAIRQEGQEASELGINYLNFPIDSLSDVNAKESEMITEILADLQKPELQPVYVHCQHGKDRTGLIVALERVQNEGWSVEDAKAEWVSFGHSKFSRIFTGGLDEYFNSVESGRENN